MHQRLALQPISARDLGRKVAEVLDRVEIEREGLLVTRGGRPIATLLPLSSTPHEGREPLVVVLSPLQERILLKAAITAPGGTGSFEDVGDVHDLGKALAHLEWDGLLERDVAGYCITQKGAVVAAVLQARAAAAT